MQWQVPGHLLPEFIKPAYLRTQPVVCAICSGDSEQVYGVDVTVYHSMLGVWWVYGVGAW